MRGVTWVGFLAALLALKGCAREFEVPPPRVELHGVWPARGFTGEAVAVCGAHLEEPAAHNLVSFGNVPLTSEPSFEEPAGWSMPQAGGFDCPAPARLLFVRVPVLPEEYEESDVAVRVENSTGSTILPAAFDYRGPGHPVDERVRKQLHLRAGLWSVFAPPGIPAPAYGAVSREADMISIFEPSAGMHMDFGQCALPISGAVAMTELVIDLVQPENWEAAFTIFGVIGAPVEDFGPESDRFFDLEMWAWSVDLKRLLVERALDEPTIVPMPELDGEPFRPLMVWSYPRPDDPLLHDVVVSHATRPALAIFPVDPIGEPTLVDLGGIEPYCQAGTGKNLGPVMDLVYDPVGEHFYAAFHGSNDIWRISRDGTVRERAWPPPEPDGYEDAIDCSWRNMALALRKSHEDPAHMRLYAADSAGARLRVMVPATTPGGDAILEPAPLQRMILDGIPYALITGRFATSNDAGTAVTGEHLYAATQNGLVVVDVTAYNPNLLPGVHAFRRVGEVPVPSNQGGPQSLITSDNFELLGAPDTVVLADAHNDLVRFYDAGEEELMLADITIGATVPRLTSSYRVNRLFLTDALSNTVQVIDRDSGVREGQFLIASLADHGLMGFGSSGMSTLRRPDADDGTGGYDLLVMPLLDLTISHTGGLYEEGGRPRFENIAFGRIDQQLPGCGLTTTGLQVETAVTGEFHQMHLVSWDWQDRTAVPVLVLDRMRETVDLVDGNGQATGEQVVYEARTWCLEVDPENPSGSLLADAAEPLCDLHPDPDQIGKIRITRPARRSPVIARFEEKNSAGNETVYSLRLLILDGEGDLATAGMVTPIGADLITSIGDLHVMRGGSRDEPVYKVYLPLLYLGSVLEVSFDPANLDIRQRMIETGGSPSLIYVSPDGLRAYVAHVLESRVDTLRLDCDPASHVCDTLVSTLDVEPFPCQVEFDDTGRHAFVLHLFSNDITVIE